jgi:hypothetical protein
MTGKVEVNVEAGGVVVVEVVEVLEMLGVDVGEAWL